MPPINKKPVNDDPAGLYKGLTIDEKQELKRSRIESRLANNPDLPQEIRERLLAQIEELSEPVQLAQPDPTDPRDWALMDEAYKVAEAMAVKYPDASESEMREHFRSRSPVCPMTSAEREDFTQWCKDRQKEAVYWFRQLDCTNLDPTSGLPARFRTPNDKLIWSWGILENFAGYRRGNVPREVRAKFKLQWYTRNNLLWAIQFLDLEDFHPAVRVLRAHMLAKDKTRRCLPNHLYVLPEIEAAKKLAQELAAV